MSASIELNQSAKCELMAERCTSRDNGIQEFFNRHAFGLKILINDSYTVQLVCLNM